MASKKKRPISRAKGYRKLSKHDKGEVKKFSKFLALLEKRQNQVIDACYKEIYG